MTTTRKIITLVGATLALATLGAPSPALARPLDPSDSLPACAGTPSRNCYADGADVYVNGPCAMIVFPDGWAWITDRAGWPGLPPIEPCESQN